MIRASSAKLLVAVVLTRFLAARVFAAARMTPTDAPPGFIIWSISAKHSPYRVDS